MKTFLILLLAACGCMLQAQQGGSIRGTVTHASDNIPIEFGIVTVKTGTSQLGAQTDEKGNYHIKGVPPGVYSVEFRSLSHTTLIKENVKVITGAISFVNAKMELKEMPGVIVYGDTAKREIWRDDPVHRGLMPQITAIDIEQIEYGAYDRGISELIALSVPRVTQDGSGNLNYAGSRTGSTLYMVDGVKVMGSDPTLPNRGIGEVVVYMGGIPAQYGDTTGGVVLINTKSYE